MRYRITTDSVSVMIDARDEDEAARKFASSERITGVRGLAGLLGLIAEKGGYATVTDDRGDVAGRVDGNTGTIQLYPSPL